jgi:polysaccharide biosynthesis protein PslH
VKPYVIASRPFPAALQKAVCADASRWGATAVTSSTFRVAHIGIALARALDLPLVVRPHNLESDYFRKLAKSTSGPRRFAYRVEATKLPRFERMVHTSAHVHAFADISEGEAERRRLLSNRPVSYLPPFLPAGVADLASSRRPTDVVLFPGSLDNSNNVEGLRWFLHEVWELVLASRPAATLRVVGRKPSPAILRGIAATPGIVGMTDLADISPTFDSAAVLSTRFDVAQE